MMEYGGEALVLRKEPAGDLDVSLTLFTKKFGKLRASAKSARRAASKLSPHLEPGMVSEVRLVEKHELIIVDALKRMRIDGSPADLDMLGRILAEGAPEPGLWHALLLQGFQWEEILGTLGWDPRGAACAVCGSRNITAFCIEGQELVCGVCVSKFRRNDVVYMYARANRQ